MVCGKSIYFTKSHQIHDSENYFRQDVSVITVKILGTHSIYFKYAHIDVCTHTYAEFMHIVVLW